MASHLSKSFTRAVREKGDKSSPNFRTMPCVVGKQTRKSIGKHLESDRSCETFHLLLWDKICTYIYTQRVKAKVDKKPSRNLPLSPYFDTIYGKLWMKNYFVTCHHSHVPLVISTLRPDFIKRELRIISKNDAPFCESEIGNCFQKPVLF